MKTLNGIIKSLIVCILITPCISGLSFASTPQTHAEVSGQIFDKVKQNENWKLAFLTAKDA